MAAVDDQPVEDDINAGQPTVAGGEEGIPQIPFSVCVRRFHGQLGTGEDHRLFQILQHKGKRAGGIRHGIGAVGDHDPVKDRKRPENGFCHCDPVFRLNIAAVQAEKLLHMDLAQSVQFRNKVQEARAGGFWRQTAVFGDGSDGSAGCDQKNLFQISSSVHRKM